MIAVINEIPISFAEIFYVDFDLSIFLEMTSRKMEKRKSKTFFKIEPLLPALISYSLLSIVFCAHWGMRKIKEKNVAQRWRNNKLGIITYSMDKEFRGKTSSVSLELRDGERTICFSNVKREDNIYEVYIRFISFDCE